MYELKINGLLTLFIRMVWASFFIIILCKFGKIQYISYSYYV